MSNKGKYIDPTPIICAAGIPCNAEVKAKDCLQYYRVVDGIDAVKHELKIDDGGKFPYRPKRSVNNRHRGIYIESKDILRPPPETRYETVINDLRETTYQSHWNQELGKSRDPNGAFPKGFDVENFTFGFPTKREYGVAELINPRKSHLEVLLESQEGHELYRKSHNDYNPGERVERGYLKPSYDPGKRYGMTTIYDPKGIWVKCATKWKLNDPLEVANAIQAEFAEKSKPKLGKALSPNDNIKNVPKNFRFGNLCERQMCGVQELIRDPTCKPCRFKRELYSWIASLNKLRDYTKKRKDVFFNMKELHDRFLFYDKDNTGWIPLETWNEVCKCFHVSFDEDILSLAKLVETIKDGKIEYNEFLTLIDVNKPCPQLMKIRDVKIDHMYYLTTNMAANRDRCTMDNSTMQAAGIPTFARDSGRPQLREGCKFDLDSLGQETSAKAVINPSIFTNYGLSHRDFFLPRSPEYIRELFENTGYQFPDDTFDKLWKMGVDLDKTDLVCVDTFKQLIAHSLPPATIENAKEDDK
ncbi:hypothetical protein Trydic_g7844 [Trypoxylus dichotomus]